MATARRLPVNGPSQVEVLDNPQRCQFEVFADESHDLVFGDLVSAIRRDVNADGIGHANRVSQLQLALVSQSRCDDVLGDVTSHVRGRTIHLRGILATERSATVTAPAAVSIDDDLATRQSGVAVRPTDDKVASRIDVVLGLVREQVRGDRLLHDVLNHEV